MAERLRRNAEAEGRGMVLGLEGSRGARERCVLRAWAACAVVLLCLAADVEAQKRRGGKRARAKDGPWTERTDPEKEPEVKEVLPGFDSAPVAPGTAKPPAKKPPAKP